MILLFCILDVFCPWSGVVDCYRSMRSFERLTLNVRSKIQDPQHICKQKTRFHHIAIMLIMIVGRIVYFHHRIHKGML